MHVIIVIYLYTISAYEPVLIVSSVYIAEAEEARGWLASSSKILELAIDCFI